MKNSVDELRKTARVINQMSADKRSHLFPIQISSYSRDWPIFYEREAAHLVNLIGEEHIFRISHFGSTSVEGLAAKPTVDILLEIKRNSDISAIIEIIEQSGYLYSYQPDNPPPHALFYKGYTLRGFEGQTVHLHMRYPGDWHELFFRDYLRTNLEACRAYGQLKQELSEKYRFDRDGYTNAKGEFIIAMVEEARKAFADRYLVETIT